MVRVVRVAVSAILPAEVLFMILLVTGVAVPAPAVAAAEAVVTLVLGLMVVTGYRLYRVRRREGADRRTATRASFRLLVPEQVRRILGFDIKGMVSLALWVARRRDGVPPGAIAMPYAREQAPMLLALLFMMVVEGVAADLLLRALHVPEGVRVLVLAVDVYSVLVAMAIGAACVTRPHVVSPGELRVRYGAFFDLRIPRDRISSVRHVRNYNESGMVKVRDGRASVAVSSQTNVIVELTEPVTVVRPLGRRTEAGTVRFFTDTPAAAVAALRTVEHPAVT